MRVATMLRACVCILFIALLQNHVNPDAREIILSRTTCNDNLNISPSRNDIPFIRCSFVSQPRCHRDRAHRAQRFCDWRGERSV